MCYHRAMRDLVEDLRGLHERKALLTAPLVEKYRKDFLAIMRNIKRLRGYKDALKIKRACQHWHDALEQQVIEIKKALDGLHRTPPGKQAANTGHLEYYKNNMDQVWNFLWEMRSFPMEDWESVIRKWKGVPWWGRNVDNPKEKHYESAKEDIRKWAQRTKRKAPAAWKWLKEVGAWAAEGGLYGGGGEHIKFSKLDKDLVRLHGFQVQIVGYDPEDEFHRDGLDRFKAGLAHYQKRAKRVFPWLLANKIPFVVSFEGGLRDAAAHYEYRRGTGG